MSRLFEWTEKTTLASNDLLPIYDTGSGLDKKITPATMAVYALQTAQIDATLNDLTLNGVLKDTLNIKEAGISASYTSANLNIETTGSEGLTITNPDGVGSTMGIYLRSTTEGRIAVGSGAKLSFRSAGISGTENFSILSNGLIQSRLGRLAVTRISLTNVTIGTLFSTLSPYLPNVGDEIICTGGRSTGDVFMTLKKTSSTTIAAYTTTGGSVQFTSGGAGNFGGSWYFSF